MLYVEPSSSNNNYHDIPQPNWSSSEIMQMLERRLHKRLQKLGSQGAYGSVFLIESTGHIVKVATKEDGRREARLMEYVHRHNPKTTSCGTLHAARYVPRIYYHGRLDDQLYFIVMENITHARTLHQITQNSNDISSATLISIRDSLQKAIQSFFAINVYHGDLHANNILIRRGPNRMMHVYIIDLGFATIVPGLSRYACSPRSMPWSITQSMRRQHFTYGRIIMHDNLQSFIRHTDTLNNIIKHRRALKNITHRVPPPQTHASKDVKKVVMRSPFE